MTPDPVAHDETPAPVDPQDAAGARLARERESQRRTEDARNEQRDGVPIVNDEAPRPRPWHDPTPMAPGPTEP